jgi:hypothetical protein
MRALCRANRLFERIFFAAGNRLDQHLVRLRPDIRPIRTLGTVHDHLPVRLLLRLHRIVEK